MTGTLQLLEDKLKAAETEKQKVDIQIEMCGWIKKNEPRKALNLAEKAYENSKRINYKLGTLVCLKVMGSCLNQLSDYKSALEKLIAGLDISRSLGEKKLEAGILHHIGLTYKSLADYTLALENYFESLRIRRSIDDREGEAFSLNNIGVVYKNLGNFRLALEYYLESLHIKEKIGEKESIPNSLSNIGVIYNIMGQFDKALEYSERSLELMRKYNDRQNQPVVLINIGLFRFKLGDEKGSIKSYLEALELCREIGDKQNEAFCLNNIGTNYSKIGDYPNAISYYEESCRISEEIRDSQGIAYCYLHLGNSYLSTDSYDKALSFFKKGLSIAKEKSLQNLIKNFHESLSSYYETMGDYFNAMKHFRIFYRIEKEELTEESNLKTKSLMVQYEADKHQKEAELIRTKNEELTKVINKLDAINDEKNNFIGIVSHDLRDPLSSIYSVADLIISDFDGFTREELLDFLNDIKISSDKVILLLQKLLDINAIETGKLTLKLENTDINAIVLRLLDQYIPKAEAKNIDIRYSESAPAFVHGDKSSIEQIFSNLISNSIKYSPFGKNIYIHVAELSDCVRFEIEDEGPGFTEEDKKNLFEKFARLSARPTFGEESTGLGLSIVKKLVEMSHGEIWCESEHGKGAKFIVELPKTKIG